MNHEATEILRTRKVLMKRMEEKTRVVRNIIQVVNFNKDKILLTKLLVLKALSRMKPGLCNDVGRAEGM